MREEDRLAALHGGHDYRVQDAKNQRTIEEQRRHSEQDYSDQLARQREQQQRKRAEEQRRNNAKSTPRNKKAPRGTIGKSDNKFVEWSTGWGVLGAIGGAIAASALPDTEVPIEGILVSAAGFGIAIGFLWKVIIACLIIGGIGFVALQFVGTS